MLVSYPERVIQRVNVRSRLKEDGPLYDGSLDFDQVWTFGAGVIAIVDQ